MSRRVKVDKDDLDSGLTALPLTASERATARVAFTRFRRDLERPGMLGSSPAGEELRVGHLKNTERLLALLMRVKANDETQ